MGVVECAIRIRAAVVIVVGRRYCIHCGVGAPPEFGGDVESQTDASGVDKPEPGDPYDRTIQPIGATDGDDLWLLVGDEDAPYTARPTERGRKSPPPCAMHVFGLFLRFVARPPPPLPPAACRLERHEDVDEFVGPHKTPPPCAAAAAAATAASTAVAEFRVRWGGRVAGGGRSTRRRGAPSGRRRARPFGLAPKARHRPPPPLRRGPG